MRRKLWNEKKEYEKWLSFDVETRAELEKITD